MLLRSPLLAALFVVALFTSSCRKLEPPVKTPTPAPDPCAFALAPAGSEGEASAERRERDRSIARLQDQAREGRETRHALEQLGYQYVARARVRHDEGNYTLAEKTAECLASTYPDDAAALLLRGHVLHQLHRFSEAEQLARVLIAKRGSVLDHGLLGDVLMEQGRLAEAAESYQKMIDIKPFYQSYTRAAHLRWLKGDLARAIELMRMAIQAASPRDRESIAWAYARLAVYELQSGRLNEADQAARAALEYQADYAAALLVRGRVLLALRRPADALNEFRRAAQLNPLPEYEWALADALRLVGSENEAQTVEENLRKRGVKSDPRTLALFLATRRKSVSQAVALAGSELRTRADVFTLDALAWSLAAAGRFDEARSAMTRAVAQGTEDGRLFLHAAAITASTGPRAEARRWLQKAERLRSTLLPSELDELEIARQRIAGVSTTQEN